MYTCPEKDIHSIYVDNELPAAYTGDYEAHVKSCPKCAAELAKTRALHEALRADAAAHTPDEHFMEQSFERLQTRMSYSRVTKQTNNVFSFSAIKWAVPAAAAAAVFAVLFVPISMRTAAPEQEQTIHAITRAALKPIAKNGVVVDGNISRTTLASLFESKKRTASTKSVAISSLSGSGDKQTAEQHTIMGATVASTAGSTQQLNRALNDSLVSVDVFRPDFADGIDDDISIKIAYPGMDVIPHEIDPTLPVAYIEGPSR